jgi:hypothetical protein
MKIYGLFLCAGLLSANAYADAFSDRLTQIGVAADTIQTLRDEHRFSQLDALKQFDLEALSKLIPPGDAVKICTAGLCKTDPDAADLSNLSVQQLLEHLRTNPHDYAALQHLQQRPLLATITKITPNWSVLDAQGKLDSALTLEYLDYLAKLNKKLPQPDLTFQGQQVVAITDALGTQDKREWAHPVLDGESLTFKGKDKYGLDWLQVPEEVRKALFWGRKKGGYELFAKESVHSIYQQAAKQPLEEHGALNALVKEYRAALRAQDADAVAIGHLQLP